MLPFYVLFLLGRLLLAAFGIMARAGQTKHLANDQRRLPDNLVTSWQLAEQFSALLAYSRSAPRSLLRLLVLVPGGGLAKTKSYKLRALSLRK